MGLHKPCPLCAGAVAIGWHKLLPNKRRTRLKCPACGVMLQQTARSQAIVLGSAIATAIVLGLLARPSLGDGVWGSLLAPAVGFVAAALLMGRRFFALEPSAPVRLGTATAWLVAGVLVMLLSALLLSGLGIPAERAALAPFVGFFSLFIGLQCLGMAWLVRKRERSASE